MPMGPYRDFDDCMAKNRDKANPGAYCGAIEQAVKAGVDVSPLFADLNGDGIDDETGEPVEMPDMPEMNDMPAMDAPEPMIEPDGEEGEDFHALLAVEGVWTGDGRWIEEGALSWRSLPLPLMATDRTTEGHMDAVLIGNITRIEREGREIHGWGRFVQSDDADIMRLQDFIRNGDLRGISVDLDAVEYDIVLPAGPITEDVIEEAEDVAEDIEEEMTERRFSADEAKMKVTAARIMGACYDDETEILTETSGWVRFEDLKPGERVATMNPKSGEFEWQEPTHYTNDPWDGPMIRFTSGGRQRTPNNASKMHRSLDLLVTPNHRMLVESISTGERMFMRADELITKSNRSYKIPATSEWLAPDVWRVKIDPVRQMANQAQTIDFDADAFAAFMGAWLAEGSLGVRGVITISQIESGKGYLLFDDVMSRMFRNYHHNGRSFIAKHTALHEWLRQFGGALDKWVPDEIKNMSARQIQIFLDAYIAGDGDKEGRRIYTSSKRMADDLQELAQKAGMWAHIVEREMKGGEIDGREINANGPGYVVNLRNRQGSRPAAYCWDWNAEWVENHKGTVRCVTVPNESLYVRRNGIPIWCGNTVVPFPAFEEAFIESLASLCASLAVESSATGYIRVMASYADIDFTPPMGARQEAERGLAWRDEYGRGGTAVGVARARDIKNGVNLSPTTVNRMASYFARHEVDKQGEGWRPGENGYPSAGRIAWALWGGDPGWAWAKKVQTQMASRDRVGSIVASAHPVDAPVVPPSAWFADPKLDGPTPLTVEQSGYVYGHLATWGTCHVAYADSCVTPPRSQAKYAHFLTGELMCDDGTRVPVGQITMDTGHAPLHANGAQALAHYDNTGTAVIDCMVGEDRFGIWMAGALRPNLDPAVIRAVMAADVSGDWRRIGQGLELVAILSVNVPGFPKNRVAVREAEGMVASLVASLPVSRWAGSDAAPVERLAAERIAATIGRDRQTRLAELRSRIHGGS